MSKKSGPASPLTPEYMAAQDALNQQRRAALDAQPTRPRGRPPTGRTPRALILQRSRDNLEAAGGRRLSVNLQPEGVQDLDAIKAAHGLATDTEAVHVALRAEAKRLTRRTSK